MANWPNTIQCLGSDDLMSLGIKSSAFLRVEETDVWIFEIQTCVFFNIESIEIMKLSEMGPYGSNLAHMQSGPPGCAGSN